MGFVILLILVLKTPNTFSNQFLETNQNKCDVKCIPANMEPFYVKDKDGICFLSPNQCVLQMLECQSPESKFDVDSDGSCGGVPKIDQRL